MSVADTSTASPSAAGTDTSSFTFDPAALRDLADELGPAYRTAEPFPHTIIEDFLPAPVIADVQAAFPRPGELDWQHFSTRQERKLASDDVERMTPVIRHLLQEFNSAAAIDFLEALTGIEGLIPDPHYWGGGLHQIEPGRPPGRPRGLQLAQAPQPRPTDSTCSST